MAIILRINNKVQIKTKDVVIRRSKKFTKTVYKSNIPCCDMSFAKKVPEVENLNIKKIKFKI